MTEPLATGAVLAVALGAFKLIERFIDKRRGEIGVQTHQCPVCPMAGEHGEALRDLKTQITTLQAWHDQTDGEGLPLAYAPRRWGQELEKIRKASEASERHLAALVKVNGGAR